MTQNPVIDPSRPHPPGRPVRPDEICRRRLRSVDDIGQLEQVDPAELRPADTIYGCLARAAAAHPDKAAMIVVSPPDFRAPSRVVSYRQLVDSVAQSACLFRDCAGPAGSVVAMMLPMMPEGLMGTWGAATAGVAVPLNPFLGLESMIGILSQTRASVLVTTRQILEEKCGRDAAGMAGLVPGLSRILLVDDQDESLDFATAIGAYAGRGLTVAVDEDPFRDAMIMPTGGTTGAPKLVRMSQAGQLTIGWNVGALMGCEPDGVVAHGMPNFHCGGTISLGLRAMMYGMTLLTLTSEGYRSRWVIDNFWDIAGRYGMTSVLATPTTAAALLNGDGAPAAHGRLQDFHVGGSTLPEDLVRSFHERFGIWLRENWGMTEAHGTVTGHPNDGSQPRVGSAGLPLPHCEVRAAVLDPAGRYVRDCAPGERGTLLVGGPTVTSGYLSQAQNDEFFVPGVPAPGSWANTGDLGLIDGDGYVWVSGRAKDLIIRGGHNLDPREIEDALSRHPAVRVAAAVGRPDRAKGELPVAYVQLKDGAQADPGQLREFCRDHVQERAAVPVEVTVLDQMPLTPVAKVSKPALRRMALSSEVAAAVSSVLGDDVACDVHVSETGRRQRVVVVLRPGPRGLGPAVQAVRERLSGYGFAAEVLLV
jgi:fatty-acyl-CoA synthase